MGIVAFILANALPALQAAEIQPQQAAAGLVRRALDAVASCARGQYNHEQTCLIP